MTTPADHARKVVAAAEALADELRELAQALDISYAEIWEMYSRADDGEGFVAAVVRRASCETE